MDSTYGSNEFWTNANRQEMMELGMAPQHEGEDFYTSLLQQGEEMKRLQKQLKKQGEDVSKPALTTSEMNTLPSDGTYSRKLVLLPEHAKIERKKKTGNTDRLWKAMGLPAPKGTKRDAAPAQNIALTADDKGNGVFQIQLTPELQVGHTAHPTVYLNNLSFTNTFANIDKALYDNADLELAVAVRASGVDSSVTVTITLDRGNYSLAELEAAIADKLYRDPHLSLPHHVARVSHDGGFEMTNAVMRGTSGSVSTNIIAATTSALALPVVPQDHSNSGLRYAEALTIDECLDLESDGIAPHKLPPVHKGLLSTSNAVSDGFTFGFKPVMLEADLQSNRVRMCLGAGVTMSTAQQASSTLLTKVLGIQSTQQGVQDSTHTFKLFDTSQQVAARIDKTRAVSFHCPSLASGTYSTKGVHGDSQLAVVPITVPIGSVQSWETFEPVRIQAPIAGTTRNELTFYITNEEGEPVNTLGERFEAVMVVEYDVPRKQ